MASIPSAFSFPIRAPPSSHSSDDERDSEAVEKKSTSSISSGTTSESETFHSEAEEEFETASERPFVADPDEEIMEVAAKGPEGAVLGLGSSLGSPRTAMPIARVSEGDDGGEGDGKGFGNRGFVGDVQGDDVVPGVIRVPLTESGQGGFTGGGEQKAFEGGNLEGQLLDERREFVSHEKENYAGEDLDVATEVPPLAPSEKPAMLSSAADDSISGIGSNASVPADRERAVEDPGNLSSAKEDNVVEYQNEGVSTNATEKQLGSATVAVDATSQSASQSEPSLTYSVEKSEEAGSGSDHASHVFVKDLASSDAAEAVDIGYSNTSVTSAAANPLSLSHSHDRGGFKELETAISNPVAKKTDAMDSNSDQIGEATEEELAGASAVGDGDSDKKRQLVAPIIVESAAQSNFLDKAGMEDLQAASTDVLVESEETSRQSDEVGHVTGELSDSDGVESEIRIVENKEDVVETPQSVSHVKAGLNESEPPSTHSVAIPEVVGGESSQVEHGIKEEIADSVSIGNKPDVTENNEAVGDGVFDKNFQPVTSAVETGLQSEPVELVSSIKSDETRTASYDANSVAESTITSKPVETEKNESGLGSVNLEAKPNELVPASGEEHENSINIDEDLSEGGVPCEERKISVENLLSGSVSAESEVKQGTTDVGAKGNEEEEDVGNTGTVEHIIREIEQGSSSSQLESSGDRSMKTVDGQIITESDEEVETDEEGDEKELFDSAALAALLKAATSAASDGTVTVNASDAARFFQVERPAGLGSSAPSLKPAAPRSSRPSIFASTDLAVVGEPENNMDEEEKKLHEKIQQIRVKFFCLVQRLGHAPEDTVVQQVLYRLDLAEGLRRGRQTNRSSRESAKKMAMQMEESGKDELNFSCNILILGKTGVGKSATINSIFSKVKSPISAFRPATTDVHEIVGIVDGVKIRVIDTPGLRASLMDQTLNRKILLSVQKFMKKCPPDIVLYVDRLDTQTRDFNDLPLLRSISSILGPSIWLNAIVALTHAASAPPDGPNGTPLSYEVFVAQRSHIVQHSIRQAAGDMRLMNPVALVENHPSCRRNREGERVLPNGQFWRPQLLLLSYSSKILSEANSLLKLQEQTTGKLFGFRMRSPPLPFLLSSLLQSRAHPKLSTEMGGDNVDSDIDLDDLSDSEQEEGEEEYEQLPPFQPLTKAEIANLSKEQRNAYFDECDYRLKLLQKLQWKEELRRLRESKKRGKNGGNDIGYGDAGKYDDQENGGPAPVQVPLPDMVLPPTFDADNPTYRYRFLEPASQLLTRPVLDAHGWDHDCGYDGVSLEESLALFGRFPANISVQVTKDKKEFNIHLDSSVAAKHGENGSSMAGFDIQSVGKQLAYILRCETKFRKFRKHKTSAGASLTFLGENIATGLKIEDQISIGKRVSLVASTGAVRAQGDVAYGANLEARLRDKDFPVGQDQSTLGLSLMRWRGDLALGANLQSQFSIARNTKMALRVGLNNKLSGQITVRTSSSDQVQIALVGVIPVAAAIVRTIREFYGTH